MQVYVSIANRNYCKKTINVMVRIATAARGQDEDGTLADFAKVLQYYMMCGNHREDVSKSTTQADWATAIDTFRTACHDEMSRRRSSIAEAGAVSSTDEMGSAANGGVTDLAHCFTSNGHARYWERGLDTNCFHIFGKNDFDEYEDSEAAILDIAGSKLIADPTNTEKNEVHSGFVYLYKVPGNDAFVKVGFTTGSVQDRFKKWKKYCNRDPTVLYPISTAAKTVVHAHRVERLVHAELMEHRIRHYCERCEKQHVEWFEVSADAAIAAVKKWSLWTAGKPYEEIEGSEWHLKKAEKNRLSHTTGRDGETAESAALSPGTNTRLYSALI